MRPVRVVDQRVAHLGRGGDVRLADVRDGHAPAERARGEVVDQQRDVLGPFPRARVVRAMRAAATCGAVLAHVITLGAAAHSHRVGQPRDEHVLAVVEVDREARAARHRMRAVPLAREQARDDRVDGLPRRAQELADAHVRHDGRVLVADVGAGWRRHRERQRGAGERTGEDRRFDSDAVDGGERPSERRLRQREHGGGAIAKRLGGAEDFRLRIRLVLHVLAADAAKDQLGVVEPDVLYRVDLMRGDGDDHHELLLVLAYAAVERDDTACGLPAQDDPSVLGRTPDSDHAVTQCRVPRGVRLLAGAIGLVQ